MNRYEEGMKLIEEACGNGKDNVIALSTIAIKSDEQGMPCPYVRDVDAFYENGVFYITTSAQSKKIQQIEKNRAVAFAIPFEGISGIGTGENLGWVLAPENAKIRMKLREVFKDWYDQANYEEDRNCVIMAVHITRAMIFRNHGAVRFDIDIVNKKENG